MVRRDCRSSKPVPQPRAKKGEKIKYPEGRTITLQNLSTAEKSKMLTSLPQKANYLKACFRLFWKLKLTPKAGTLDRRHSDPADSAAAAASTRPCTRPSRAARRVPPPATRVRGPAHVEHDVGMFRLRQPDGTKPRIPGARSGSPRAARTYSDSAFTHRVAPPTCASLL